MPGNSPPRVALNAHASSALEAATLRPLPERPNLEFERKRAKKLVRESERSIKLAEAQWQIAREYGFASWRKLVAYYVTWDRHHRVGPFRNSVNAAESERSVKHMLEELATRKKFTPPPPDIFGSVASIAAYLPRLYGATDQEIVDADVTEDEVRFVVARMSRYDSWPSLMDAAKALEELVARAVPRPEQQRRGGPVTFESLTIGNTTEQRIDRLFVDHPTLREAPKRNSIVASSSWHFVLREILKAPSPREMLDWVASLGVNVQANLNQLLLGPMFDRHRETNDIRGLLELGADPCWIPCHGYSILEHAIVRYCNGEAVDLIAERVKPRRTMWVAAGLGDASTAAQYFTKRGTLTEAARRDRPDFTAFASSIFGTTRPNASDRDILFETFMLAGMNGRLDVMDVLLGRGYPIDYTTHYMNLVHWCAEFREVKVLEHLIARGADVHFKRPPYNQTALGIAQMMHKSLPDDPRTVEILNLLS